MIYPIRAVIDSSLQAARLRRAPCRGVHVLCYHGVVERMRDQRLERNFHTIETFRTHIALLRRLHVVSLGELEEILSSSRLPKRGVLAAITLDDGYANNLVAAELLEAARLPWTLFVSTGPIDAGGTVWTAEVSLLLLQGQAARFEVFDREWALTSRAERELAFQEVRVAMKQLSSEARRATMSTIRAQFPANEIDRLLDQYPSMRMMSATDLRELARTGVGIGSHGVNHEIHHIRQPESIRSLELSQSREAIRRLTDRVCEYFAFPNGTAEGNASELAMNAGYKLAFATHRGLATPVRNHWSLPRIDAAERLSLLLASPELT